MHCIKVLLSLKINIFLFFIIHTVYNMKVAYLRGGEVSGAWGADAPASECSVPFFCPLFHFKIIKLLKVFYNFTKFLHNFI